MGLAGMGLVGARVTELRARAAEQPEPVHFKPGTTSTVLLGTLKGWDMKEYGLGATKGQTARLEVTSRRINRLIVRFYPADQPGVTTTFSTATTATLLAGRGRCPKAANT
jgi:hypothetical protein